MSNSDHTTNQLPVKLSPALFNTLYLIGQEETFLSPHNREVTRAKFHWLHAHGLIEVYSYEPCGEWYVVTPAGRAILECVK